MADGLKTTFELLGQTPNEAAVSVLIPALDAAQPLVRQEALRAILRRRSPSGIKEAVARMHQFDDRLHGLMGRYRTRMSLALRDAVLSGDRQASENACRAIVAFRDYDVASALIHAIEEGSEDGAQLAARTLLELVERLWQEANSRRDYSDRRDPRRVRAHVVESLEASLRNYAQHKRREIVEAFLVLAGHDNSLLRSILQDPHQASYLAVVDVLSRSGRPGVIDLILRFLDDSHPPSAALSIVAHRGDELFVVELLRKLDRDPPRATAQNLRRIESLPWLSNETPLVDRLDDRLQESLVRLVVASGLKRSEVLRLVGHLMEHGTVGGRRAACTALADLSGASANNLVFRALEDGDPQVQARAAAQLRQRGMPGALSRLLELIDSPHAVVRDAARGQLGEFRLEGYLAAFDALEDSVRRSTGAIVRKVEPHVEVGLRRELAALGRSRRLRAIAAAEALGVADQLADVLIGMLEDSDHMVRMQAARCLASCDRAEVRTRLVWALGDKSASVRQAVRESLAAQAERWAAVSGEPSEKVAREDPKGSAR